VTGTDCADTKKTVPFLHALCRILAIIVSSGFHLDSRIPLTLG